MGVHKKLFLPRANLSWVGTIIVLWWIGLSFVGWASFANFNNVVRYPYLMSGLFFTSCVVSGLALIFTIFYWGPSAGTRKKMSDLDPCRMYPGESLISWELRTSRIVRCYGDVLVEVWTLATSAFVLIWMVVFYWYNDVLQFQPLPPVFTSLQLYQFMMAEGFGLAMAFIGAITVLIAIDNTRDMFKRFMLYVYLPHIEATSSAMESRQSSGATSTLLGEIDD